MNCTDHQEVVYVDNNNHSTLYENINFSRKVTNIRQDVIRMKICCVWRLAILNMLWSETSACILKAHSHSMSGSSIWDSLDCHCCFWMASDEPYHVTTHPPAIQKQHWQSREAQIEPPLIEYEYECEWAFRIRAFNSYSDDVRVLALEF
jgi:hypothetical protein